VKFCANPDAKCSRTHRKKLVRKLLMQRQRMIRSTGASMFAGTFKGMLAAAVLTVAIATPAQASPIALDGSWTKLIDILPVGEYFTGKGYGSTTQSGATSFDWSSPLQVLFKLTDLFVVGDHYRVFDKGQAVADVTNGLQWRDIPGCHGSHSTDCHWTSDPDEAWSDEVFAKQEIVFAPGDHSITIQVLGIPDMPGKSGEHNPHYIDSTAAFSAALVTTDVVPTPEPASLLLLGTGLSAVAIRVRRRRRPRA
jgi:hypothetical protein